MSSASFAQISKFQTESMCYKEKSDEGTWTSWSDWMAFDLKIHIDFDNDRVYVFSDDKRTFKISEYLPEEIDGDGDSVYEFICVDADGVSCRIRLMILKTNDNKIQFYIDYFNYMFAYNVILLE